MHMLSERKSVVTIIAVAAVMLFAGAFQACYAANLLTNNGFELWGSFGTVWTGSGVYSGVNEGWNYEFSEDSITSYIYSDALYAGWLYGLPYAGTNALRMQTNGYFYDGGRGLMRVWQDIEAAPDADHTASVWCRTMDFTIDGTGFGSSPEDRASLIVEQYDSLGQMIGTSLIQSLTDPDPSDYYRQLVIAFRTDENTAIVRYKLEADLGCAFDQGFATFDEAILDGPASAKLTGTITSGGQPVAGAAIAVEGGASGVSGADGTYLFDVSTSIGQRAIVRVGKSGYYTVPFAVLIASGENILDVELTAVDTTLYGLNLLANPGFEVWGPWGVLHNAYGVNSGTNQGWDYEFFDITSYMYSENVFGTDPLFFDGGNALRAMSNGVYYAGAPGTMQVSQDVEVISGKRYVAAVWVRTYGNPVTMTGFGLAPEDYAALIVQEMAADNTPIGDPMISQVSDANKAYRRLSLDFTAGPTTAKVRYILKTHIASRYEDGWVTYDGAMLDGPGTATVAGKVVSGETPIEGATVMVLNGPTLTTNAQGEFGFSADAFIGQVLNIRVSKDQYYTAVVQHGVKAGQNNIEVNLTYRGANLLTNPGFEDSVELDGWKRWNSRGDVINNTEKWNSFNWYLTNLMIRSGTNAASIWALNGSADGKFWQDVPVLPNTAYSARCYFKAGTHQTIVSSWGIDPDQKGALFVQELDVNGDVVVDHPMVYTNVTLANLDEWHELALSIPSTNANTVKIRIGAWTYMYDGYGSTHARAVFDDFSLEGPMGNSGLSGTVRGGGVALPNAVVNVYDWSGWGDPNHVYLTAANGSYTAANIIHGTSYTVSAYKAGFFPQAKSRAVDGLVKADFDLIAIGSNILQNPSFDEANWSRGWVFVGGAARESGEAYFNGPTFTHSAEEAVCIVAGTGNADGSAYQEVAVVPGSSYTARCKFLPGIDPRYPSVWGTDARQKAGIWVQELDSTGGIVVDHPKVWAELADLTTWQTLTLPFTTSPTTAKVRVGCYAFIVDAHNLCLGRAVFDSFELNGDAPVEAGITIAAAKALPNGSDVILKGKIVSAVFANSCYIQEPDRSSGILVNGYVCEPGGVADIKGKIVTNSSGEKAINITLASAPLSAGVPRPLGIGGRSTDLDIGLQATGLYVKTWGRVETVVGRRAVISDGGKSLRVILPTGVAVGEGDMVSVTGALSVEPLDSFRVSVLKAVAVEDQE